MSKMIILIGLPASGKTTWAKDFISQANIDHSWIRVCRDDIRFMLQNVDFIVENEKLVSSIEESTVRTALAFGKSVVIDATNIKKRYRNQWHKIAKEYNVNVVEEKFFSVSLNECIDRNNKRDRKVPESVIKTMFVDLNKNVPSSTSVVTTYPERFVMSYVADESLDKCIVVDIDGTISDSSHRNPYDTSLCYADTKITNVVDLVQRERYNGINVVFLSARCERYRDVTETWLKQNLSISTPELYLKPDKKESDPDFLFKSYCIEQIISKKYNILYCLDDRPNVCHILRKMGLTVFQLSDEEF